MTPPPASAVELFHGKDASRLGLGQEGIKLDQRGGEGLSCLSWPPSALLVEDARHAVVRGPCPTMGRYPVAAPTRCDPQLRPGRTPGTCPSQSYCSSRQGFSVSGPLRDLLSRLATASGPEGSARTETSGAS